LGNSQEDGVLTGGWGQDNPPEKIGETVHREVGENDCYVHSVLSFLNKTPYCFAPNFLGLDEDGREILEYIEGVVPHSADVHPKTWSIETMQDIFKKIRELHDLTSGSDLAGNQECVCHGDLSYANTVYRDGKAVAFIDWDWAHPGKRIDDVAHAVLEFLSIGEYEGNGGAAERAELARALVDAYGLSSGDRSKLLSVMLQSLLNTRQQQLEHFRQGKASAIKLVNAGVPEQILKRYEWLQKNEKVFQDIFERL